MVLQQFYFEQANANKQHFIHLAIKECYGTEKKDESITWLTISQIKAISPTKINVIGE